MSTLHDNPWLWYWATSEDADHWCGGMDSRESMLTAAIAEADASDHIWICEARKAEPRFTVFEAGEVLELFEERNEECWGEDGAEIKSTREQDAELETLLAAALATWVAKYRPFRVYMFGDVRVCECARPGRNEAAA